MGTNTIKIFIFSTVFLFCSFVFVVPEVSAGTLRKPANNLGLVGYWSFNEGTSTIATDFSGRGNTGTLNSFSAPATVSSGWGSGKFGHGLNFDGTGDYVSIDGVANDVTETSFAFSVWIKSTWTAGFDTVLAINTAALGNQTQLFIDNTLSIRVYDGTQDATELSSSGSVVDGKWHHVVYSRSGATGTLYVDGVSQGTHNSSDTFTGTDLWSLGQEFDAGPVASDLYAGGMDDVRIYNRPLSGTEVLNLYNTGLVQINSSKSNLIRDGLAGYWPFDGSDLLASFAYDRSGNNNTGILTGTRKVVGKMGQALSFDGSNEFIDINDNASLNSTTNLTVMAWIKRSTTNWSPIYDAGTGVNDWVLQISDSQKITFTEKNIFDYMGTSDIQNNVWQHVAVVKNGDGASNVTFYLNGVADGTASVGSVATPSGGKIIGYDGSFVFNGSIDDVRVYNRALTISEIKNIYNSATPKINSSQNVINGSTLQTGLVGMWSFNGPDLTDRVYDRSGQGNDGYFVNISTSTAKVPGKIGQALMFNGTSNHLDMLSPASLDDLPAVSYSFWIKPRSAGGGRGSIVSKTDTASVIGLSYVFFDNTTATNGISFLRDTGGATDIGYTSANNAAPLNQWTHGVVTWDGSVGNANNVRIYINGVETAYQITDSGNGLLESDAGNNFKIGARSITGGERYFDGAIDEVRVYNRVITPSEVKQLYLIGR